MTSRDWQALVKRLRQRARSDHALRQALVSPLFLYKHGDRGPRLREKLENLLKKQEKEK